MDDQQLTGFQELVEQEVRTFLDTKGIGIESRELVEADVPFYSRHPFLALRIRAAGFELWVYDNELGCSGIGEGLELELADFDSPEALAEELIRHLGLTLGGGRA